MKFWGTLATLAAAWASAGVWAFSKIEDPAAAASVTVTAGFLLVTVLYVVETRSMAKTSREALDHARDTANRERLIQILPILDEASSDAVLLWIRHYALMTDPKAIANSKPGEQEARANSRSRVERHAHALRVNRRALADATDPDLVGNALKALDDAAQAYDALSGLFPAYLSATSVATVERIPSQWQLIAGKRAGLTWDEFVEGGTVDRTRDATRALADALTTYLAEH